MTIGSPRSFIRARSGTRIFLGIAVMRPSLTLVPPSGSAPVLEGQQHARAIRLHFVLLNLQVLLYNLGDSQVTQRARRGFHRILCGVLPRLRARADYFHDFIDRVRSSTLFAHNFSSTLDVVFDFVVMLKILARLHSPVNSSTR